MDDPTTPSVNPHWLAAGISVLVSLGGGFLAFNSQICEPQEQWLRKQVEDQNQQIERLQADFQRAAGEISQRRKAKLGGHGDQPKGTVAEQELFLTPP